MMTIWILWSVLTLVSPQADVVLPVDEFENREDCSVQMRARVPDQESGRN